MALVNKEKEELKAQVAELENKLKAAQAPVAKMGVIAEADFPPDFFGDPNFIASGNGYSGLYPLNYFRAVMQAERLVQSNGFYFRVLEMARDHVCGQGIQFDVGTSEESLRDVIPCLEEIYNELLFGDVNNISARYYQWVFETLMTGMLLLPVIENEANGEIRLGDIPTRWVVDVAQNPLDASDIASVRIQASNWKPTNKIKKVNGKKRSIAGVERMFEGDGSTLPVVRYDNNEYLLNEDGERKLDSNNLPISNPDRGTLSGSVFLLRMGNLRGQKFGQGDAFHIHDLCTELEQLIFLFRRAYEIQLNVTAHIKITNASEDSIKKYSNIIVPTSPMPFVSDENVELKLLTPALNPVDLTELVQTLARFIGSIMGIPEYGMGDGTNTNVATAREQAPIMYQKFNIKRVMFQTFFEQICKFQIAKKNKAGMLYRTKINPDGSKTKGATVRLTVDQMNKFKTAATLLPYERNNTKELSDGLKSIADAIVALLAIEIGGKQLFDPELLRRLVYREFSKFGLDVDEQAADSKKEVADTLTGTSPTGAAVDLQDV